MASPQPAALSQLMTPDAIVIYPSRKKLLLIALGCAAFVVGGLFLLLSPDPQLQDTETRLIGALCVAFSGFCLLFAAWRLIRPTPALIIHSSGIFDHASALSAGFLRWDEISAMHVATIKGQRSLAIAVKDVDAFLRRQSGMKAKLMKMNVGLVGAAVNIPASILPISLEELIRKIQEKSPGISVAP